MLLLSSRYTSDSDLHAVFMSFLRRFLGVSRLVNLPNLNVVPVVPVVPRRLYPLSLFSSSSLFVVAILSLDCILYCILDCIQFPSISIPFSNRSRFTMQF